MYYGFTYNSLGFYHGYNFRVLTSPNMSFFLIQDPVICKQDRSVSSFLNHTHFNFSPFSFPLSLPYHIGYNLKYNVTEQ